MNLHAFGRQQGCGPGTGEMGHTLDLDLLQLCPVILDVGCSGFGFTREVLEMYPAAWVAAMDPNPTLSDPQLDGCEYIRAALVGSDATTSGYARDPFGDGLGNFLVPIGSESKKSLRRYGCGWTFTDSVLDIVNCVNIEKLMIHLDVEHWDAVKLDCEDSEYEILENWPGPIATQISVEFHDFTGPLYEQAKQGYYEKKLWPHLFQWYRILQHEWLPLDDNPLHRGHWDSVLVLK